jgi:hypothetical protein
MLNRLRMSLRNGEALKATRVSIGKNKLVYVLIADKRQRYAKGKSRIVYIGTTKKGVGRVAGSVASRAEHILRLRGVTSFHARVITCQPRQSIPTWLMLERAFLLSFKTKFGEIPVCNSHGKGMREGDEYRYFHKKGVANNIDELS